MATGAPDGVLMIQVAVTIDNVPTVQPSITAADYYAAMVAALNAQDKAKPATEYPVGGWGHVQTLSADWVELKSWIVTTGRVGVLKAVEVACDNYAVAKFKLLVAGVTVMPIDYLPESFSAEFTDLHLAAGQEVILYVQSNGSTTISAYGWINCKEVG